MEVSMPSRSVNRGEVLVAIAFTALVASIGAFSAYRESRYWPNSHGIASWSAATRLALFAIVVGNLVAFLIAGVVFGYKRLSNRESPPVFGIYVTMVNVIVAFLLWILPKML
jgi:hypothetical protein